MQTARLLQAVVLMMMVAVAASCATSHEYVSKLFKPRSEPEQVVVKKELKPVKFLEFDSTGEESDNWVKTDIVTSSDSIIMARATAKMDSVIVAKPTPIVSEPVAKTSSPDGTRNKKSRD